MKISEQIKTKIKRLPNNKAISFKELRLRLGGHIKSDSVKQALHRLHNQGIITINSPGQFIKEKPINTYLFVYGSLKKGFENNHIISKAVYISKAKTKAKYAMFKETKANYPYMIKDSSLGGEVEGELYEINRQDILDDISAFEGAPDYFELKDLMIKTRSRTIKAKTFLLSSPKVPLDQEPIKVWKNKHIKTNFNLDQYFKNMLGDV